MIKVTLIKWCPLCLCKRRSFNCWLSTKADHQQAKWFHANVSGFWFLADHHCCFLPGQLMDAGACLAFLWRSKFTLWHSAQICCAKCKQDWNHKCIAGGSFNHHINWKRAENHKQPVALSCWSIHLHSPMTDSNCTVAKFLKRMAISAVPSVNCSFLQKTKGAFVILQFPGLWDISRLQQTLHLTLLWAKHLHQLCHTKTCLALHCKGESLFLDFIPSTTGAPSTGKLLNHSSLSTKQTNKQTNACKNKRKKTLESYFTCDCLPTNNEQLSRSSLFLRSVLWLHLGLSALEADWSTDKGRVILFVTALPFHQKQGCDFA